MLDNSLKKSLREHGWSEIEKNDKNKYQTWRRIKDKVNRYTNDMRLLIRKLPYEKQEEILTKQNIDNLLAILFSNKLDKPRRVELASLLVRRGLFICKLNYLNSSEETPEIAKVTTEYLDRASKICEDISYKLTIDSLKLNADKEELTYLFNWNKVTQREKDRLLNFLIVETKEKIHELTNVGFNENKTELYGKLILADKDEDYYFVIKLHIVNNRAELMVKNNVGFDICSRQLSLKSINDEFYLYSIKKKYRMKKQRED